MVRPPTPDHVVVGLDVGTSATKAVAFAPAGWSRLASRDHPLDATRSDRREQDPAVVASSLVEVLAELVDRLGGARVAGVATSAAMHGVLGLDETGTPVTPLVTWADGRAGREADTLAHDHPELHGITGMPPHPMAPIATIRWFTRRRPEATRRVRWWVGLKDWVLLVLTGRLVTEPSSASGTGLFDVAAGAWHDQAVALAGITGEQLPAVVPVDTLLPLDPDVAARIGLAGDVPVVAGAADGPLGNLGVGAVDPGVVGVSLGTSGAARRVLDTPPRPLAAGMFDYLLSPGQHVVGAAISTGGVVADWAVGALAPDLSATPGRAGVARLLDLAAEVPAGSAGVVALPHLLPARAPHRDPDLAGTWLGVRSHHDRRHLARAAVEGVALQLDEIVARLGTVAPVEEVRATGGALRADLWRGTLAAALARPITLVGAAGSAAGDGTGNAVAGSALGGTALGAAALGWWALGRAPDAATARSELVGDERTTTIEPDAADVAALRDTRERRDALLAALGAAAAAG